MTQLYVKDIRNEFRFLLDAGQFVRDKSGCNLIEITGQAFIADEESIFGEVNHEWSTRELKWYESLSLSVKDIPPPIPKVWEAVSSKDGKNLINSNYGWCIWSEENGSQYAKCLNQLLSDSESRRAIMIYTRPSMQVDYNTGGMSDFMCTNTVQYLIRNGKLHAFVNMRSNDVVFGYKGDRFWQLHVLKKLVSDFNERAHDKVEVGNIIWNAVSLHVYERHFKLIK